jgi:hypothetical protein
MCWKIKYLFIFQPSLYLRSRLRVGWGFFLQRLGATLATMGFFNALNHLLNFVAPAAAMALLLACFGLFFKQKRPIVHGFTAQAAIIFIVSASLYSACLWFFGHDGKIASYALMVLAGATAQFVMLGLWR